MSLKGKLYINDEMDSIITNKAWVYVNQPPMNKQTEYSNRRKKY